MPFRDRVTDLDFASSEALLEWNAPQAKRSSLWVCPKCPYWSDRNRWAGLSVSGDEEPSEEDVVIGVAWYRPEQYERLLEISVDGEELEATYDEWMENAEDTLKEIQKKGIYFEKVDH